MSNARQVDVLLSGIIGLDGAPLSGGKVYCYNAGSSTLKNLYNDVGLTVASNNPVILDENGRAIKYALGSYKLVIKDFNDSVIYTFDNLTYGFSPSSISADYLGSIYLSSVGGDSTNIQGSTDLTTPISSLSAGMRFVILMPFDCSANATLEIDSATAVPLYKPDGSEAVDAGYMVENQFYEIVYDGSVFRALSTTASLTSDRIGLGSIDSSILQSDSVGYAQIQDDSIDSSKIMAGGVETDDLADGSVTTPKLASAAVTTAKIDDGAITTAKIADSNVTTNKINDGAVTTSKIADANVTTAKIVDANVTEAKINTGAVTTTKIADSAVTTAKIDSKAVTTAKIADGAVTGTQIYSRTITGDKIALNAITGSLILDGEITSYKIRDGAVATARIADSAVTTAKIDSKAVTTAKIADGAVTGTQIYSRTITGDKIALNAITGSLILDGEITSYKIRDGAVATARIADSAVTTAKINNGAVTDAKLASSFIKNNASSATIQQLTVDNVYAGKNFKVNPNGVSVPLNSLVITPTANVNTVNVYAGTFNGDWALKLDNYYSSELLFFRNNSNYPAYIYSKNAVINPGDEDLPSAYLQGVVPQYSGAVLVCLNADYVLVC